MVALVIGFLFMKSEQIYQINFFIEFNSFLLLKVSITIDVRHYFSVSKNMVMQYHHIKKLNNAQNDRSMCYILLQSIVLMT